MRCGDVRLSAYLDGELEPFERAETDAHVAGCEACARELHRIAAASAAVKAWTPPDRRRARPALWIVAAAAALLTLLVIPGTKSPVRTGAHELAAGETVRHAGRRTYVARDLAAPARVECAGVALRVRHARFEVEETVMHKRTKATLGAAAVATTVVVVWGSLQATDRAGRRTTTLEPGRHELSASAEAPPEEPVAAVEEPAPFDPFTGVTGVVVGPDGAPVPDATVEFGYTRKYAGAEPDAVARSGPDGTFRLGPLRPRHGFFLSAFEPELGAGDAGRGLTPGAHVTIRLEPAARLEGRLVDAGDGSGIEGAVVVTRRAGGGWNHERTTSDAEGRFVLETCDADAAYLWIRPREHEALVCHPVMRAGETATVEIPLRRLSVGRARVVDAETKQPVEITAARCENHPQRAVRLLGDGWLEFHVGEQYLNVLVEARGYAPAVFHFGPGLEPRTVEIARGRVLQLRVVDESGTPVAGARVRFVVMPGQVDPGPRTTDERGSVDVRFAVLRSALRGAVEADGFAASAVTVPPFKEDFKAVEVRLERAGILEGRVVGPEGAPLPGARVDAEGVRATSGADGRFRVDAVPAGEAVLKVETGDHAPFERRVEVCAGEATSIGDVALDAGAEITGWCADVNGARVRPTQVWSEDRLGTVARDGSFRLGGFVPGRTYELHVQAGGLTKKVEARAGARDLQVVLEQHASIRGRVVVPEGETLPVRLSVGCAPVGRRPRAGPGATVFVDGTFRVPGVAAGPYRLTASAPGSGFAPGSADVEVNAGETKQVTLRLEIGGAVEGAVDRAGVESHVYVRAMPLHGGRTAQEYVKPTGEFRFDALAAGSYTIAARTFEKGFRGTSRAVVVAPRETVRCDLALVATGDLVVRAPPGTRLSLEDAEGRPVPVSEPERRHLRAEAARRLANRGAEPTGDRVPAEVEKILAETDADGAWRRYALFPGTYAVVAGGVRHEVEVRPGMNEIDLR